MAETFTAEIHIGGCVPLKQAAALSKVIADAHVEVNWGAGRFWPRRATDLLEHLQRVGNVSVLRLCDDQASWGEFGDLESFLVRHRIPFNRFTEGKWEYAPQLVVYRPGAPVRALDTNTQREPIVPTTGLDKILAQLMDAQRAIKQGKSPTALKYQRLALRQLKRLLPAPIRPLPTFEIAPAVTRKSSRTASRRE